MTTATEGQTSEQTLDEAGEPEMSSVMISLPVDLKMLVKQRAVAVNETTNTYLRSIVAAEMGFEGRLSRTRTRAKKYATETQRIAVTKARQIARREAQKELMARYKDQVATALQAAEEQALREVEATQVV